MQENSKKALRTHYLDIRNSIDKNKIKEYSIAITNRIIELSEYKNASCILSYASYGSELDTSYLHKHALSLGKEVYYPKVCQDSMIFYKIDNFEDLEEGYKGILEPSGTSKEYEKQDAFMLVPGVVMGRNRYRIGYGKGFYDRFLAMHKNIFTVGGCYESQLIEAVPGDEHDVKMHCVVTECSFISK